MASKQYNSGRGRGRYRRHRQHENTDKGDKNVDESSPMIQAFRVYQKELDSRNDRYERIVKLSRDITIESKRIIFLLQRCAGAEERESVLIESAEKFKLLYTTKFHPLALELHGQDPYQFLRAYSPGLQEYIEAVTFYNYLLDQHLVNLDHIQSKLTFIHKVPEGKSAEESEMTSNQAAVEIPPTSDSGEASDAKDQATNSIAGSLSVLIPPSEYMLGVADFTGELMRMAINSVGAGDLDTPSVVTNMMRTIHGAFTAFNNPPRELRQKTRVLSQSLHKVEQACYTLQVRGSEIPKHMLADVFSSSGSRMPMDSFTTDEAEEPFD